MLQYGVQDTCYLLSLVGILERELMAKGRLFCVEEECELLSGVRPNSSKKRPFFPSFKGAAKLDPRSLAILENVLVLRDQLAENRDCPHFKVLGNRPIIEIARIKPVTKTDLAGIKDLSVKQIERMGGAIIRKVREGLNLPDDALPVYPKKKWQRLRPKEAARVKALKGWREHVSNKWEVDPSVVCTNAQIQAIAIANPGQPGNMEGIKGVRKWQIRLFGPDICNLLQETG